MKKEICAGALLLLLILGAVWNLRRLERLAGGLTAQISLAELAAEEGDLDGALSSLRAGYRQWEDSRGVNALFLSRSDIERVNGAFQEAERALLGGGAGEALAAGESLRRCLEDMLRDQRPFTSLSGA